MQNREAASLARRAPENRQVYSADGRRQSELEGCDPARRDECGRGQRHRTQDREHPALPELPRRHGVHDAPKTLGETHHEAPGHLRHGRARDGRHGPAGINAIGAQRRRYRHHRQNLSRRPELHV